MAELHNEELDPTNEEGAELDSFDAQTDKELEEAGDDPAKLKELLTKRTETRQRLYARLKKAEADAKTFKQAKEDKPDPKTVGKKIELGYGEKGFLVANGIKGTQEFELVQSIMKESGKSLDEVLESRYFLAELKSLRDENAALDAAPRGNGTRGGSSAKSTVDYWIEKGGLPEDTKLARQVVAERNRRDSVSNKFGGAK